MSWKVTGRVWDLDLEFNEAWVLLAMADHADHGGGGVAVSIPFLAWKTGYSERQVKRIKAELEKKGIVVLEENRQHEGKSSIYRIELDHVSKKKIPRKVWRILYPGKPYPAGSEVDPEAATPGDNMSPGTPGWPYPGDTQVSLPSGRLDGPTLGTPGWPDNKTTRDDQEQSVTESARSAPAPVPPNGPPSPDADPPPLELEHPPAEPPKKARRHKSTAEAPVEALFAVYCERIGSSRMRLTPTRRTKLRLFYEEHLAREADPLESFRLVCDAVANDRWYMADPGRRTPERLFDSPEVRDTWAVKALDSQPEIPESPSYAAAPRAGGGRDDRPRATSYRLDPEDPEFWANME